ncbi:MAG TPA: hypothetical protein VHS58_23545 [Acetobacteraceae bacterium]|nr:hypothetical protein [Acetobacteraceae bacterium]
MLAALAPVPATAYTAADAFWTTDGAEPAPSGLEPTFKGTYAKTITERLGIEIEDGVVKVPTATGFMNVDLQLKYEAIQSQTHEFIFSVLLDQEIGGTGNKRVTGSSHGATQPGFGNGFGDVPVDFQRPLAVTGFAGYAFGEGSRPNALNAGFSVQYSIPYLVSKVTDADLPPLLRALTPIVEVVLSQPSATRDGKFRTLTIAPGFSYTQGNGREFAVEALFPATKNIGHAVGVFGQLTLQLDYLLPDSILGRPLFAGR